MGKIANRYRARAARVGPATAASRGAAGRVMLQAVREATEEQLYARTPLPVSRAMFRSIRLWFRGVTVEVGFDEGRAKHAGKRLSLRGTSPSGGHDLSMNVPGQVRREAFPMIRAIMGRCQQRIVR